MYADIEPYMFWTVAASIMALYVILGFPRPEVPDPNSQEKFITEYGHTRKNVGYIVNSRTLEVEPLPHKVARTVELLQVWSTKTKYQLVEAAHLLGTMEDHSRYNKWGRLWFVALQNALGDALTLRSYVLQRLYNRH